MLLKILQWNIWYKEDIKNIAKTINDLDPDIACLQELRVKFNEAFNAPEMISRETKLKNFNYHFAQSWQNEEQGDGIFSKHPILTKSFNYVQDPNPGPTDANKEGRIYVETQFKLASQILTIGTTHLSYEPEFIDSDIKLRESERLHDLISQKSTSYILAADLNTTPKSKVFTKLLGNLKNLGPELDQKTWKTRTNSAGSNENKLKWRIDYVLGTEDIKVAKAKIVQTSYSDHFPILVEIEV